jgi:ketosteroid isomerase-like protein
MRHGMLAVIGVVLALSLTAPDGSAQQDARAAIEDANKQFSAAFSRGDGKGLGAMYTATAQAFPPNSDIVQGSEAIGRFWQGAIDSGVKGVQLTTLEVEAPGDVAYEVGKYTLTGDAGKVLDQGKYAVVWKRELGQWKLHRDIWNTSVPAAK